MQVHGKHVGSYQFSYLLNHTVGASSVTLHLHLTVVVHFSSLIVILNVAAPVSIFDRDSLCSPVICDTHWLLY